MALGLLILIAMLAIVGILIGGAGWLSAKLLPWFSIASVITFVVSIIIFLPLSALRATRAFAAIAILIASYIFGATVWMEGLVTTLDLWGGFAVFIGLCLAGVGIVPLGMLAALFHGSWSIFFEMLALIALTFGCRFFALWLEETTAVKTTPPEMGSYYLDTAETETEEI